jgi:transposase-like protein
MPETRRKFDPEFREGAVRIVRETGKPIAQVARDLGINAGTLANWCAREWAEHEGTEGLSTGDVAELKRLRVKNAQLRMGARCPQAISGPVGVIPTDEVSVARLVADQRTMRRVPHTVTCAILRISISWFYKWIGRGPTERQRRPGHEGGASCSGRPSAPTVRPVSTPTWSRPARRWA